MKVLVVNLDRNPERFVSVSRRLSELGVEFERISAVDGSALAPEVRRDSVNRFRWWCAVGRTPSPAEIGCAKSHYGIYERISEPVCVIEDDVEISADFQKVLRQVGDFLDPSRPQVVLLSDRFGRRQEKDVVADAVVRSRKGLFTDGYVITPSAARALLKLNGRLSVPCDWWARWVRCGAIELYHAPTVIRQRRELFGSSTSALRNSRPRPSFFRLVVHKGLRLVGRSLDWLMEGLKIDG